MSEQSPFSKGGVPHKVMKIESPEDLASARHDPEKELYERMADKPQRDQLLLATMLHQAIKHMSLAGHGVHQQVVIGVNRSALTQFAHMKPALKLKLLKVVPGHAEAVIKAMNCDDVRQVLLAVAYLTLECVDQGLAHDPSAGNVLGAMGFIEDAKEHAEEWCFREAETMTWVKKAHDHARLLGYL